MEICGATLKKNYAFNTIWGNSTNATPKKVITVSVKRDLRSSTDLSHLIECKCKILNFGILVFFPTVLQSCAQDCLQQDKFSSKFSVVLVHYVLSGIYVHLCNFTHGFHPIHYLDGILKLCQTTVWRHRIFFGILFYFLHFCIIVHYLVQHSASLP